MDYIWLEQSLRAYSFLINQSFFASILTTSSLSYMLMSNTYVIYSLLYIIHEYLMYMSANTPNAPICALYVLLRITLMPRIRALYVLLRITLIPRIWAYTCYLSHVLARWWVFSLTERTEFTEHFFALFRAHRRPPAYRVHRALLLKVAVRVCEIGWLNVSVGLCEICSSVFFCEK